MIKYENHANSAINGNSTPISIEYYEIPLRLLQDNFAKDTPESIKQSLLFTMDGETYVKWIVHLHAGVTIKAHERDRLEKVCRYIARPAVAEERLSTNDQGDVIYRFKKPWDDGTTAMKLTPMQLMERLVALVPRPRVHSTRYHGLLGPQYKYRKQIIPKTPTLKVVGQGQEIIEPNQLELKKKNIPWARLLARVFNIDVETYNSTAQLK